MVVLVLLLAVAVTAYVGRLMWHAPASTPSTSPDAVARRAQRRAMKRRLAAAMSGRAGDSSAQWTFSGPSPEGS